MWDKETVTLSAMIALSALTAASNIPRAPVNARSFVEQLYASDRLSNRDFIQFFGGPLQKLVTRDRAKAGPGYVGFLDFDPICQCQDDDGLQAKILKLEQRGGRATAIVQNSFAGAINHPIIVTYQLQKLDGAWRIVDVGVRGRPSLRLWLKQALDAAAVRHR